MGLETATILGISAAVSAIGTGVAAYGSIASSKAAADAADYEAQVAENNAKAQAQQAQVDADRLRRRNRRLRGKQTTAALKSGFTISGSVQDIIRDSGIEGEKDVLARLYTGSVGANRSKQQANLSRFSAKNLKTSGYVQAGGSVLSGAGSVLGTYGRIKNPSFGS